MASSALQFVAANASAAALLGFLAIAFSPYVNSRCATILCVSKTAVDENAGKKPPLDAPESDLANFAIIETIIAHRHVRARQGLSQRKRHAMLDAIGIVLRTIEYAIQRRKTTLKA